MSLRCRHAADDADDADKSAHWLGHIQTVLQHGSRYSAAEDENNTLLVRASPGGTLLNRTPLGLNNLSQVNFAQLEQAACSNTNAFIAKSISPYNPEQLKRMQAVRVLHEALNCPGDATLISGLTNGSLPGCVLTPTDVLKLRDHYGPCPQCLENKIKTKPMPSSLTLPATKV